ncbi:MAG: penicillin acylase family protein [Bradymonadia bacterium]
MNRALIPLMLTGAALSGCDQDSGSRVQPPDAAIIIPDATVMADAGVEADADVDAPEGYQLQAPVEFVYDEDNVPHIYAQNDLDLMYAAGFQQARDHLWVLDVNKRRASGRLAEIFGESAEGGDIQSRALRFPELGAASAEALAEQFPEEYELLEAFAAGINRHVDSVNGGTATLPEGFEEYGHSPESFTAADLLTIGVRIQFGFSSTLEFDLLNSVIGRIAPDVAAEVPVFAPGAEAYIMDAVGGVTDGKRKMGPAPFEIGAPVDPEMARVMLDFALRWRRDLGVGEGSNLWAVNGRFTDNGRPLLANDSHAGLLDPNRMYMAHLNSADAGGSFDVIGVGFFGVPGIQVGHNGALAWGATTHFADMMDLWDVAVADTDDGLQATFGDQQLPVLVETQIYQVKGEDGALEDRTLEVRWVEGVGVLLPEAMLPLPQSVFADGELIVGWPGYQAPNLDLRVFLQLMRAETLDEFEAAISLGSTGMQNWTAASAEGIRYRVHGLVPDRGPVEGRPRANTIMQASDISTLWRSFPLDWPDDGRAAWLDTEPEAGRLPHLGADPDYIMSANNDPWGHTADNDPLNDDFYYGSFYAPGYRAGRLKSVLEARIAEAGDTPITRAETEVLQNDAYSLLAEAFMVHLEASWAEVQGADEGSPLSMWAAREDIAEAVATLTAWDRHMIRSSQPAALYRIWYAHLARITLFDDLNVLYETVNDAAPVTAAKITHLTYDFAIDALIDEGMASNMMTAMDRALTEYTARGEPTWGDVHRSAFVQADGETTLVATDGAESTVNVAQCPLWSAGELRELCVASDGAVYRMVHGFGEDGVPETTLNVPFSNAYPTEDWIEGRYRPLRFRAEEISGRRGRLVP